MKNLTVVFDLDGTLVDTAPDLVAATNHVLQEQGISAVDGDQLRGFVGFGAKRMIEQALEFRGVQKTDAEVEVMFSSFINYYSEHTSVLSKPFPNTEAMLENLMAKRVKMAVCTNKVTRLSKKLLTELGLSRFFRAVVGRDSLPVCKPDAGHLVAAIIMSDGNLDNAVMVGDTTVDRDTAKNAGIPFVAVTFGYNDEPVEGFGAQAVVDNFADMEAALAACNEARQFTL